MGKRWFAMTFRLETNASLLLPAEGTALGGSMMKGAMRNGGAEVLAALGRAPCRRDGAADCPLCRLFGVAGKSGALHWSPLSVIGAPATPGGVTLAPRRRARSRAFGASFEGPSAFRAVLASGVPLSGGAQGWFVANERATAEQDAGLLVAAAQRLQTLGGGRAYGAGRVTARELTVRLDGIVQSSDALLAALCAGAVS